MKMNKEHVGKAVALSLGIAVLLMCAAGVGSVVALSNNEVNLGDVYTNALYNNIGSIAIAENPSGWTNPYTGSSISFIKEQDSNKYYIPDSATTAGASIIPGTYVKTIGDKTYLINVKYPTVTITGNYYENGNSAVSLGNLIGGTVSADKYIKISVPATIGSGSNVFGIGLTNPDGSLTTIKGTKNGDKIEFSDSLEGYDFGTWELTPIFKSGGANGFSNLAPEYMYGEPVSFTVINTDTTKRIEPDADDVTQGGYISVSVTAPSGDYKVSVTNGNIASGQTGLSGTSADGRSTIIHVGPSGTASLIVTATNAGTMKIALSNSAGTEQFSEASVTVIASAATPVPTTPSSTSQVNDVPSQVTQGKHLVISGTTTGHTNDVVTVILTSDTSGTRLSTLTTRIGDDGVWTVDFDTTNLNPDDYTISTTVGQLNPVTAKTRIISPNPVGSASSTVAPTQAASSSTPAQTTASTQATSYFTLIPTQAGSQQSGEKTIIAEDTSEPTPVPTALKSSAPHVSTEVTGDDPATVKQELSTQKTPAPVFGIILALCAIPLLLRRKDH